MSKNRKIEVVPSDGASQTHENVPSELSHKEIISRYGIGGRLTVYLYQGRRKICIQKPEAEVSGFIRKRRNKKK